MGDWKYDVDDELNWKCEYIKNDDKTWTWSVLRDRHVYESKVSPDLQTARGEALAALKIHKKRFERDNHNGQRKKPTSPKQRRTSSGDSEGTGDTK